MRAIRTISFLLCVAVSPLVAQAAIKTATVERLLQRQFVGNVLIDEERELVYFELVNARGTSPARFPYTSVFMFGSALKKVYVAPIDGIADPKPLFEQDEAAGYYFASDNPWSPSKRYLTLYKLLEGQLRPGVYDLLDSKVRFFDVATKYGAASSHVWVSDDEFIVPDGESSLVSILDPYVSVVNGARAASEVRERGWLKGEVTADVVGAGRYAAPAVRGQDVRLVRINVRTGVVERLEQASFAETEFTKLLAPKTTSNQIAIRGNRVVKATTSNDVEWQAILSIVDTSTGERRTIVPAGGASIHLYSWSDSGRYILTKRTAKTSSAARSIFSIVDTTQAAAIEDLPNGTVDATWIGDRLAYVTDSGPDMVDTPGFDAVEDHDDSISFEIAKPKPVATFGSVLFYLNDGDLWRVDGNNTPFNLTSKRSRPIAQYEPVDGFRVLLSLMKSPLKVYTPSLDELVFRTEDTENREFIVFSSDGSDSVSFYSPNDEAQLLAVSTSGAVFLSNSYERGSQLLFVKADATAEPQVLCHFNKQLAGTTPATAPIALLHKGYDGEDVTGWLYLPPGASLDNPKQYPMVMIPYAGNVYSDPPSTRSLYTAPIWDLSLSTSARMEVLAARGYAVFLPSIPLGARGEAGEPMSEMMPAILTGLDAAIDSGFVDPNRVALSGHSYGGYTALSVAAQTDRFRAIIASAPASNLVSMFGQFAPYLKTNSGGSFTPGEPFSVWAESGQGRMGAPPWEDPDRYVRNSPVFFADRVRTPLMLIHGGMDYTTIPVNSEEIFTALRRSGKDVVFVRYLGEEHAIEQPQNQRDMWERVFDFLEDNGVTPGPKLVH